MKVYIRSSACISAQKTFGDNSFLAEVTEYTGTRLTAIEPDYKQYFDPIALRRMGHVIKMGVAAAKECLKNGGVEMPGAIITGTAFGVMADTITFLTRVIEQDEEMLPPTAFIQSTHNTVAAQVALALKCHAYNNTFVHKAMSFESALLDATMLLNEQEADNILVGGTEEMVDTSFKILTRLGLYKCEPVSTNLSLFNYNTKGTIGGEGAGFFLLTDKESPDNQAELTGHTFFYRPKDLEQRITAFLYEHSLTAADIDLVITGKNGDKTNDAVYRDVCNSLFQNTTLAAYKHLCGEYTVASTFGLWLAANIMQKGVIPGAVLQTRLFTPDTRKILLYNHYQGKYHSLMLVSKI